MIGQDTHFLRVGFLSMISKVVVDQVIVQVFGRNTVKTVYKPLQTAVVGVHSLDVVKSKRIHGSAFQTVLLSNSVIGSCSVSTEDRTLGDVTSDNRVDAIVRSLTQSANLGNGQPGAIDSSRNTDLLTRQTSLSALVKNGCATLTL